ncbi:MAG TPA: hypothetical protein VHW00_00295 [Thermoanaerobaculia bacterium]|nr:hypothetical protein [Thermoanaerobaculia bacterium]
MIKTFAVLSLALFLACAPEHVSASRWTEMSHDDRVLYVNTLLGAEKVKDAKGGTGKAYTEPAEEYVKEIDAAYARGDARDPEQIFAELGR